jgi:structure-specific recognition protein 1
MRFHVPNNEVDKYYEEKQKEKEAAGKTEEGDNNSDDEAEITASKLFNDKIV